jgi:uncharacterized lipoprotein
MKGIAMKQNALIGLVSLGIFLIVTGCMSLGGAKFPQTTSGFQPKKVYDKTYDQVWTSVRRVLETERIGIASSDKEGGRMVTDHVQGETQLIGAGLLGGITTRYSYTITLDKVSKNQMRVGILCKLESMSEGLGWHDVSKDNQALVKNLESWLYERIEASL